MSADADTQPPPPFLTKGKAFSEYARLDSLRFSYLGAGDLENARWCRKAMMRLRRDYGFAFPARWWYGPAAFLFGELFR